MRGAASVLAVRRLHSFHDRTKAALAAKKTNGAKLGNPSNLSFAGSIGRTAQITAADEFVSGLLPVVFAIRQTGANTLETMSCAQNKRGIRTARGGTWHASVANLVAHARRTLSSQEAPL